MEEKRKKNRNHKKKIKIGKQITLFLCFFVFLTILGIKIVPIWVMAQEESKSAKAAMPESERVVWVETTELDGSKKQVPVPKGFSASQVEGEMTVNGGFVIYEGNIDWDSVLLRNETTSMIAETSNQTPQTKSEETTNQPDSAKKNSLQQVNENKPEEAIEQEKPEKNKELTNTESLNVENSNTLNSNATRTNTEVTNTEHTNIENTNIEAINVENANTIINEVETKENQIKENTQTNEITTTQEKDKGNEVTQKIESNTETEPKKEKLEENKEQENPIKMETEKVTNDIATTSEEKTTTCTPQEINIFTLQKSVDQYVWVPVDDVSRLYGVDSNGKLWGKLYNFSSNGRTPNNWEETDGIFHIKSKTSFREPDITHYKIDIDIDSKLTSYLSSQTEYELLSKEIEQNFCKMIESIEKYGGFYIGRYETGRVSSSQTSQAVVKKMNTNLASISWYNSYQISKELSKGNENIETSLMSGVLWDETLEWLQKSRAKTYTQISDSISWGNYSNSHANLRYIKKDAIEPIETEQLTSNRIIPSGSSSYTKANNIYDMAGNVWEWTLETCATAARTSRGGNYYNKGVTYPASKRGNYAATVDYEVRFAFATLYTGILKCCILIRTLKYRDVS